MTFGVKVSVMSRSHVVGASVLSREYWPGAAMNTLTATRATLIGLALLATPLGGETHPRGQVQSLAVLATPEQLPDQPRMGVSPAAVDEARKKSAIDAYGSLPLGFEPNRGQTDPRVKFLARGHGLTLFLSSPDAVLVTRGAVIRMRLLGANPDSDPQGLDELPGRVHSFIGRDPGQWRINAPTYARVRYRAVYPGIDLVYYGTRQRRLEYDFVVAPNADPRTIRLGFEGVDRLKVDADGDLLLHVGDAALRFAKPLVYQTVAGVRREIPGGWVREGAFAVGFRVAAYDPSVPLVIDPVVSLATYIGGEETDQAFGIALDTAGNVYLTGNTTSINFPTTIGSVGATRPGGIDAFVVKLDPALSAAVYSTYLGGTTGDDAGRAIAVDGDGNAYVTGFTNSSDFPILFPPSRLSAFGGGICSGVPCNDAFVVQLGTAGALFFATYLGGSGSDVGLGIAVDPVGDPFHGGNGTLPRVHVTGGTFSTNFPTTPGSLQPAPTPGGSREAFYATFEVDFNDNLALQYSTLLRGAGDDVSNAIVVDSTGAAYVTGSTASANFLVTAGALQTNFAGPAGGTDAFVTKFDKFGALVYSTYLGGSASDEGLAIAVDDGGNAYITGVTSSRNFPATGTFTFSGAIQAFLTKIGPPGTSLVVSRAVPTGTFDTTARDPAAPTISVGMARDGAGNIYIAGSEVRCVGPGCTPQTDAFVVSLDPSAMTTNTIFVDGSGDDFGLGLAVDVCGNVFLTGDTNSADFPVTPGVVQGVFGGGSDAFVVKIEGLGLGGTPGAGGGCGSASGGGSSSGDSSGGGSSSCFIATAVFGSPMASEVHVLREFRDRALLPHKTGRVVVAAYNWLGPPLARVIARSETLKALVRAGLRPIISTASLLRGRAALAFYLVVSAGSLMAAAIVSVALARCAELARRRAIVTALVIAVALTAGVALLDQSNNVRSLSSRGSAVDRGLRPERRIEARTGTHAVGRTGGEVSQIGRDRYAVSLGSPIGWLPSIANSVEVRPTFGGLRITSEIGDGILTAEGLIVTDPKLSASVGLEPGDRVRAINGHPPTGGVFLALIKLRRDPDSGALRLDVERGGQKLERVVVIR
jgi:hypothetical protein